MARLIAAVAWMALLLSPLAAGAQPLGPNILKLVTEPSGTAPQLAASGLDTNIDVNLVPKGIGCVRINGGACIGGGGVGTVTGSGTTGTLTKWLNGPGSVLGDSIISESAGVATVTGSLILTTRTGTPATMAVFTAGGVLAETTLPTASVSNIATSTPITGGPITTTGTIGIAANALRRTCTIIVGADNGAVLVNADLGPQGKQCFIPAASTILEVDVAADTGTPSVLPRKITAGGAATNLLSGALSTAAAGAVACSNTGGTLGLDGATTCAATLTTTALAQGVWLELLSGTAGGTAHRMSISVTYCSPSGTTACP